MDDLSVPATVRGTSNNASHEPIEFQEQKSGQLTTATASPNGKFNIHLPEGHYDVRQGSAHASVTVLPGGFYDVDLRSDRVLDFKVTSHDLGSMTSSCESRLKARVVTPSRCAPTTSR
jgi:hypothetical protein